MKKGLGYSHCGSLGATAKGLLFDIASQGIQIRVQPLLSRQVLSPSPAALAVNDPIGELSAFLFQMVSTAHCVLYKLCSDIRVFSSGKCYCK